jgi:hypothetical protein
MGKGGISPGGHFEYGMDYVNRICETVGLTGLYKLTLSLKADGFNP